MNIFIQITRPSDLRSLCLVSKQVSRSATPLLYRNIFLPFDARDPGWTRLERLADSDGVFDGHVKSVNLGSCDYTAQKFCKTLQNFIENLPDDTLRRFDFSPLARPTHEDIRRLFRSQQRLTNLKLDFSLNSPSISEIVSDHELMSDFYALESLSEVYIDFGTDGPEPQARDFVYRLTKRSSTLRKVILKALPELSKLPDASILLPQSLLSSSFPSTLTHISLWYYTCETTEDLNLNQYPALTDMELIECGGVKKLLDNYLNPTLMGFVYRHECAEQGKDRVTAKAIIEFIKRMKTPKRLTIDCEFCFSGQETHLASTIAAHADKLEYLLLTCHNDNYGLKDEVSFTEAASRCTRLKQLGISLGFGDVMEVCRDLIDDLPHLSSLNLFDVDGMEEEFNSNLALLAHKIFNLIGPTPRIRLLAFGKTFHYGGLLERQEDIDRESHQCFLRSKTNDPLLIGLGQAVAVPVEFSQIKYIEPYSDLLEYEFGYS
ncbi:hypothetical protein G7Y79_00043g079660 [Physcia stellaris]|nr:hypothetical protein G7Y79_00043g079660 [Physcia stellaris]